MALVMPLRATEREEALGMDVTQHGEEAYATGEGAILVTPEAGSRPSCRWPNRPSAQCTVRNAEPAVMLPVADANGQDDRRMT